MNNIIADLKGMLEGNVFNRCAKYLPGEYLGNYKLTEIVSDCNLIVNLNLYNEYELSITPGDRENIWQIKLLRFNDNISLSRGLPIIENFGFKLIDEKSYKIKLSDSEVIYVCDFGVEVPSELINKINDLDLINKLKEGILASFLRGVASDRLNYLVLYCGLSVREVSLLRAISRYLIQINLPFSPDYISDCFLNYKEIAYLFFKYFNFKFSPTESSTTLMEGVSDKIKAELSKVSNLAHDQILKTAFSILTAMLRTNFYQLDKAGKPKYYISFKLESTQVLNLPKPHPRYEIFVYSRRFEAIHLRSGMVARGGLRWSDRFEDFRTEVLGLVKAQKVKNTVIVPTGSKGGFVCKKLPDISDRQAYLQEAVSCYQDFIRGLLDITDNLVDGKIVTPTNVVRHDGDDPYLVVAADKGTATFSDYANSVSKEYGFWLGDAFASGGANGYDHKKIGITAKGAWEAIKCHFRHLGLNTQTEEFTVIGIGDMMGDVFGNGMLLSPKIKLLAAFNHQHIFIDPNPNCAESFKERTRLFNLERSSWEDYDKTKISTGGGIYARNQKSISLTPEVKAWLELESNELTPTELIHQILKARADLLYNGGIGTYIKASYQSHEEVKDKANDNLRVNASQLQVKVIGEGGNLGATQAGRIEFAKMQGNLFTDAIDNSAGVDCSDHEVNIKILFASIIANQACDTQTRNEILANMTDEVASLVLRDNYLQTLALKTAQSRAHYTLPNHIGLMHKLEKNGELDRAIEFLPDDKTCETLLQNKQGLTLPELSVLLAYSKISLLKEILATSCGTDPDFEGLLINYFPKYLQENYLTYIKKHYLRAEIIASQLTNLVVNRAGMTFVARFSNEFSCGVTNILKAWWIAYSLLDGETLFKAVESLDNKINAKLQTELFIGVEKAIERLTRWILIYYIDFSDATAIISKSKSQVVNLEQHLSKLILSADYPEIKAQEDDYISSGVPLELASVISRYNYLPQVMDIVTLAIDYNLNFELVAANYFSLGRSLGLDWMRKNVLLLPRGNKWQGLARAQLLSDIAKLYRKAMLMVIQTNNTNTQEWVSANSAKITKLESIYAEIRSCRNLDLAMLSAVLREFSNILA